MTMRLIWGGRPVTVAVGGGALLSAIALKLQLALDAVDSVIASVFLVYRDLATPTDTVLPTDRNKVLRLTGGENCALTIPNDLSGSATGGFVCGWKQSGAGRITFTAAGGTTLRQRQDLFETAGEGARGALEVDANPDGASAVVDLYGDLG